MLLSVFLVLIRRLVVKTKNKVQMDVMNLFRWIGDAGGTFPSDLDLEVKRPLK